MKLHRVYDGEGAICQISPAALGVLFDPITGGPVAHDTERWHDMVRRLYALDGVAATLDGVAATLAEAESPAEA